MAISLLFSVSMNFYFVFLFDKMDGSSATAFNNNTSSSEHRHGPPQLSALTRQGGLGVGASFHNKDKKRVGRREVNTVEEIIHREDDDDSIQQQNTTFDHGKPSTSAADRIYDVNVKDMSIEDLWSRIKAAPKPDGWETYGFRKIRHHFKCKDYAHNRNKPLPTIKEWKVIKDAYLRYVDENQVFVESDKPDNGYNFDINDELYYAATGKNGRGLFSTREISKGEIIHNGAHTDLIFPNAKGFRQLVFNLPRDRACDVIDWTWTANVKKGGPFRICFAMNISILANGGRGKEINMTPLAEYTSQMFANRDIMKGEELMFDYHIYSTTWSAVGLGGDSITNTWWDNIPSKYPQH